MNRDATTLGQVSLPGDAFRGKTAIVRGAAVESSPGYALARAFARHGANLVLVSGSKSKLKMADALAEEFSVEVKGVRCVLTDTGSIGKVVDEVAERFGRIDALVNAALLATPRLLKDVSPKDLERVLNACTVIPFAWMRACLPHLSASHGLIISLGSRFAEEGLECLGALAAATQGFAALNAIAAKEWRALGVSTNIVQASARNIVFEKREAEFGGELASEERTLDADALDGSYDELAQLCLHLASEEGHDITGRVLRMKEDLSI